MLDKVAMLNVSLGCTTSQERLHRSWHSEADREHCIMCTLLKGFLDTAAHCSERLFLSIVQGLLKRILRACNVWHIKKEKILYRMDSQWPSGVI